MIPAILPFRASLPWYVQDVVCHQSWSVSGVVDMFQPRLIWFFPRSTESTPKNLFAPYRHPSFVARHAVLLVVHRDPKLLQRLPDLADLNCPSPVAYRKFWLAPAPLPTRFHPTSRSQPDHNYPIHCALHCMVGGRQWPCPSELIVQLGHTRFICTCTPFPRQEMNLLSF